MGPQAEDYIETVLTCEGDFYDPKFHNQLRIFSEKLEELLLEEDSEHPLILKKVEPWNSVKVTFNIPKEAAVRLKCLAEEGHQKLKELGILAVQIEGDRKISLRIAGRNNETTELIFRTSVSNPSASGISSVYDLNSSDEIPPPKNVEGTRKNIAQYLGQQHVREANANVHEVVNHASRHVTAANSSAVFSGQPGGSDKIPGQGYDGVPLPIPPQISPKFPTPPPSVSTPSSPGPKAAHFPHHLTIPNAFGNQAAVSNMVSRLLSSKANSATSPLLVNLLQNDAIAAAAAAAAVATGTLNAQTVSKLVGIQPPEGPPPKKRKRRKPKEKVEKEPKKGAKSEKETENAIHNILNQVAAESVQDRVPPFGNEHSPVVSRPNTPAHKSSPSSSHAGTPSKSPVPHAKSPKRSLDLGPGQRQIINPSTGQLEVVDDDNLHFSPTLPDSTAIGPVQRTPPARPIHSPHFQSTSPAFNHSTQGGLDMQLPSSGQRSSPVAATLGSDNYKTYRNESLTSGDVAGLERVRGSAQGRKSPGSLGLQSPHFHQQSVPKSNPNELIYKKSSYEAAAQSNSAIMPVVSNIANVAGIPTQAQGPVNVSMQNIQFINSQQSETSQLNQMPVKENSVPSSFAGAKVTATFASMSNSVSAASKFSESLSLQPDGALSSASHSFAKTIAPVAHHKSPEQLISVQSVMKHGDKPGYSEPGNKSDYRVPFTQGLQGQNPASITASQKDGTSRSSGLLTQGSVGISNVGPSLANQNFEQAQMTEQLHTKQNSVQAVRTAPVENHVGVVGSDSGKLTKGRSLETSCELDAQQTTMKGAQSNSSGSPPRNNSEHSNNSCDDHTKHGSVDSGLGDIKNNGESPCGSSGNDSPGVTVASSVHANPGLPKLSDKNVLTVGYVLSDENDLFNQNFMSKPGGDAGCFVTDSESIGVYKRTAKEPDSLPVLMKPGGINIENDSEYKGMQLNHDHLSKSLNLIGRSDLNPGGITEAAPPALLLNGDDASLHGSHQDLKHKANAHAVQRRKGGKNAAYKSDDVARTHPCTCAAESGTTNQALDTVKHPVGISTLSNTIQPPLNVQRQRYGAKANASRNMNNNSPVFSKQLGQNGPSDVPRSNALSPSAHAVISVAVTEQNNLGGTVNSKTCRLNVPNSGTSVATNSALSSSFSSPMDGSRDTPCTDSSKHLSVPVNPLLVHGHLVSSKFGFSTQSLAKKSLTALTNGPVNAQSMPVGSHPSAVSDTTVSSFSNIPRSYSPVITSISTSVSTGNIQMKTETPFSSKPGENVSNATSVAVSSPALSAIRTASDNGKVVSTLSALTGLTTVAPSVGHLPMRSQMTTTHSSKVNTGMASLGPSPIMSTGLPYFSTQNPRQVTPPPESAVDKSLKAVAVKGISIMKPLHDRDICEDDDSLGSPVKEMSNRKSPKKAEKNEKVSAGKKSNFTVAQLLHDAEKKVKESQSLHKPFISSDSNENVSKTVPPTSKPATVALQNIAKNLDAKGQVNDKLFTKPIQNVMKITSQEDVLMSTTNKITFVQKPVNSSLNIVPPVQIPHPNITITAPEFHMNLTESVQKVMKVVSPSESTSAPSGRVTVSADKSVLAGDSRKSPVAHYHTVNSLCHGEDNLLIASAAAKHKIQDEHKEKHVLQMSRSKVVTSTCPPAVNAQSVAKAVSTPSSGQAQVSSGQSLCAKGQVNVSSSGSVPNALVKMSRSAVSEYSYSTQNSDVKTSDAQRDTVKGNCASASVENGAQNDSSTTLLSEKAAGSTEESKHSEPNVPSPVNDCVSEKDPRAAQLISSSVGIEAASTKLKETSTPSHNAPGAPSPDALLQKETNRDKEAPGKVKSLVAIIQKNESLKSSSSSEKSAEPKHSTKLSHFPIVTTVATKETSKTVIISSKGGESKETTNFSLDLRSAVTASSSSKFIKLEPSSGKEWRVGHATKVSGSVTIKAKGESKQTEGKSEIFKAKSESKGGDVKNEPVESTSKVTSRRPSVTQIDASCKVNDIKLEIDLRPNDTASEALKESAAQKLTRASVRRSSETPIQEAETVKPARIKRRGSRASTESKASSCDGARAEESPTSSQKMSTRGRRKTTSESSENQDVTASRRSSGASTRDRSASPSPHNTRSNRTTRKKAPDTGQEPTAAAGVDMKAEMQGDAGQARATRSSKRKLHTSDEKDQINDVKKSRMDHDPSYQVTDSQTKTVHASADSVEQESKAKATAKARVTKAKGVVPLADVPILSETASQEDKGGEGSAFKRSTRSARLQDHCELPNTYAKKKQKVN